jgi:peroxiredoxin Q/BCP
MKKAKAAARKTPAKSTAKKSATKKTSARKAPAKKPEAGSDLLAIGARAPEFKLPTETGETVSLSDFAGKTVVLYFYPKDDTPGCTQESCDFRDSFSRLRSKNVVVLGVSKDSVASHRKFKDKYSLPFTLVSDEKLGMIQAYRVWKEKSLYGRKYMGVDRTTYLIDVDSSGKGKVRKAYPKVKVTGHVDAILKDLGQE